MSRSLALFLALLFVLLTPVCANAEPTQIHFMMIGDYVDLNPAWTQVVDAYNQSQQENEVVLDLFPGAWADYLQKLTTLIAADEAPDLCVMSPVYLKQFTNRGQFVNLNDFIKRDLTLSDYFEASLEGCEVDGVNYGIPIGGYTMVMFYNKDMFDAAGIAYPSLDWQNAWTLEQWQDTVQALTSGEGAARNYGFNVNFSPERSAPFVYGAGADFFNADRTECTMNDPAVKKIYQILRDMIYETGTAPSPAQTETLSASEMFMAGRLAMIAEGEWMIPSFITRSDYHWGVAPIPGGRTVNFIDQYVIFEASKKKEETWDFIKFLIGEKASNILVDCGVGGIPFNRKVAEDRLSDIFEPLTQDEKNMIYESIGYSQPMNCPENWSELLDTLTAYTDLIALNEMDVDTAMDAITQELNGML